MSERPEDEKNNKATKSNYGADPDNKIPNTILITVLFGMALAAYELWKFVDTFIFTSVTEDRLLLQ